MKEPDSLSGKALFLTVANMVGIGANVLTPILLVRIFDKEDYGLWGMFFFVLTTVFSMMGMTVNNSASYFFPRKELPNAKLLAVIIWFNLASGFLAFLVFRYFPQPVLWVFRTEALAELIGMIGLLLFIWNISRGMALIPIAMGRSSHSAVFVALTEGLKGLFVIIPALVWGTLSSVILGVITWSALRAIMAMFYYRSGLGLRLSEFSWSVFRSVLSYSFPFGIKAIATQLFQNYHHFLVGHFFDARTYAVFRTGVFQIPMINTMLESVHNVVTPEFARMQSEGAHKEMIGLMGRVFVKLSAILVPVFAFGVLTAEEFIRLLFTEDYLDSVGIFRINLIRLLFLTVMIDPMVRAFKELRMYQLVVNSVLLAIMFALGAHVVDRYGIVGAVVLPLSMLPIAHLAMLLALRRKVGFEKHDFSSFAGIGRVIRGSLAAFGLAWVSLNLVGGLSLEGWMHDATSLLVAAAFFVLGYWFAAGPAWLRKTLSIRL